jgi:hypothetical protein
MNDKKQIICITQSLWDGPKRVRHNLMREYAKRGHKVVFVEAYLTWVKLLKGKSYWKYFFNIFKKPRLNEDGVYLAAVPPFIPGGEWIRIINSLNWLIISFWVKYFVIKSLKFDKPVLFTFSPLSEKVIGKFNESLSIYFCNDPFKQIFKYKSAHKNIERIENVLTGKADLVFGVSEKLVEERLQYNPNTHLIPLAVNDELFNKAYKNETEPAKDIELLNRPVIGHIGVLNNRIDIELMFKLAETFINYSFVFIGPVMEVDGEYKSRLDKLKTLKNIHFLGNKKENELPSFIKPVDICIIPYVKDDVTKYIKANSKFFQYVSSGKPVVSTIGPVGFGDELCIQADSFDEFVSAIKRALEMNKPEHLQKRKEFIKQHTWSARVDEIEKKIEEFMCFNK